MDEQNPDKIPLNPIQRPAADNQLFENPQVKPMSGRDQVLNGMFKRPKQEPTIPFKYQMFLTVLMLIFVIATVLVGMMLFRNGFY